MKDLPDGFRVKVYRLQNRDWSDNGTGLVEVSTQGEAPRMSLLCLWWMKGTNTRLSELP